MNYASTVLKIAEDEVGYLEKKTPEYEDDKTKNAGYNNYTKYARDLHNWVGSPFVDGYAWCQTFVMWIFYKAFGKDNAKDLLGGWTAYCPTGALWFKQRGQYYKNDPQKGDVIYFLDSYGEQGHVGIVRDVDDTYVYTIEGNTSPDSGVVPNGGGVHKKTYSRNYSRIDGYGRPKYDEEIAEPDLVVNGLDYSLVYEYDYYINRYEDIKNFYGTKDKVGVFNHFLKYGMKEARQAKEDFNVITYKDNYKDLQEAYGTDAVKYYEHYMKWGYKENRVAAYHIVPTPIYDGINYEQVYDGKYYREKYKDLQDAYGDNYDKYIMHFVKWGMKERRIARESFNVNYYMTNYKDLRDAYGSDYPAYYKHYMIWGQKEGRVADKLIKPVEEYYTYKKGDSIAKIASQFNITVDKLLELNNIKFDDGQKIRVR